MSKYEPSPELQKLIEAMRDVYYEKDPRNNGSNPACRKIEDKMTAELNKLSDEELLEFIAGLDEETDDLVYSALWELSNTREVLWDTKYYLGSAHGG